ncbi:MAG: PilZ domain-containing protein [Solirubrobacteraceae bacterium]
MRRLLTQQAVTIDLDPENGRDLECIDCSVGWVLGPVATLTPIGTIPAGARARLEHGALCFMTFEHRRTPVALRGIALAVAMSSKIEFVVIDGIQVSERRSAERVPVVTPIRATSAEPDSAVTAQVATVTSNLSVGGALLTRRPGLGEGPRWQIELTLPGDPVSVRCDAQLARRTPTHVGVRFENMQEADQLRLARTIADRQRRSPPGRSVAA